MSRLREIGILTETANEVRLSKAYLRFLESRFAEALSCLTKTEDKDAPASRSSGENEQLWCMLRPTEIMGPNTMGLLQLRLWQGTKEVIYIGRTDDENRFQGCVSEEGAVFSLKNGVSLTIGTASALQPSHFSAQKTIRLSPEDIMKGRVRQQGITLRLQSEIAWVLPTEKAFCADPDRDDEPSAEAVDENNVSSFLDPYLPELSSWLQDHLSRIRECNEDLQRRISQVSPWNFHPLDEWSAEALAGRPQLLVALKMESIRSAYTLIPGKYSLKIQHCGMSRSFSGTVIDRRRQSWHQFQEEPFKVDLCSALEVEFSFPDETSNLRATGPGFEKLDARLLLEKTVILQIEGLFCCLQPTWSVLVPRESKQEEAL